MIFMIFFFQYCVMLCYDLYGFYYLECLRYIMIFIIFLFVCGVFFYICSSIEMGDFVVQFGGVFVYFIGDFDLGQQVYMVQGYF